MKRLEVSEWLGELHGYGQLEDDPLCRGQNLTVAQKAATILEGAGYTVDQEIADRVARRIIASRQRGRVERVPELEQYGERLAMETRRRRRVKEEEPEPTTLVDYTRTGEDGKPRTTVLLRPEETPRAQAEPGGFVLVDLTMSARPARPERTQAARPGRRSSARAAKAK